MITLQLLGVGAAVLGDMSARPNWGLGELDFVFSTIMVCGRPILLRRITAIFNSHLIICIM